MYLSLSLSLYKEAICLSVVAVLDLLFTICPSFPFLWAFFRFYLMLQFRILAFFPLFRLFFFFQKIKNKNCGDMVFYLMRVITILSFLLCLGLLFFVFVDETVLTLLSYILYINIIYIFNYNEEPRDL